MGRPSKLTPEQWTDIIRRVAEGEQPADLAREFDIHPSQITRRVSQVSQSVRNAAEKMADAQAAIAELPRAQQYQAMRLADQLRNISGSLASAAELGAKTAHRLNALANSEVGKVDDANPLESLDALKGVSVLTKLANSSADIALNLLSANKDTVRRLNEDGDDEPEELTPERLSEGARRIAFVLSRATTEEPARA